MTVDLWLAFVTASLVLCFTPGPTVFLVVGQALAYGKRSIVPLAAGALVGDIILLTSSFLGLGLLLAISATLFNFIKFVGAAYLIYLGIKAFCRKSVSINPNAGLASKECSFIIFRDALLVTALNPKGMVFFMAFLPLFISTAAPVMPQMIILAVSFLAISLLSVSCYALLSGFLRGHIAKPKVQERFNKLGGSLLVGAGLMTASMQHG
ncbi:LysE family translocator [Rheinheimera sp. UJ51]|uniref:LysE family translocator n=1 Tax=Rheinheimera sp. UJ51 TaxID=2892446 RepID=UPI001E5035B8|nr:LysE family translocator [Rheinheimera sp. UJ51]MCC5451887.1 LysE family translocator [Rheinheimera sp. UJ51]